MAFGFFILLFVAALATSLSLVELASAPLRRATGWSRGRAALVVGIAIWAGGIPTVLSFNLWRDVRPLAWVPALADLGVYASIDGFVSNVLLPVGGVLFAILVGRLMPPARVAAALGWSLPAAARLQAILRWPVPAVIVALVVAGLLLP